MKCCECGRDAEYIFPSLEVQTLHVRDLKGESRVQALGLFREDGVCRECAAKHLAQMKNPMPSLRKKLLPYAAVLVFGVLVTVFLHGWGRAVLMMGLAGILCGVLGLVTVSRTASKIKREYSAMTPAEAERRAAWELTLSLLPKKDGDNDMSYIPLDERTMNMKNGDLMIEYRLLPEIAKKAWFMIHDRED